MIRRFCLMSKAGRFRTGSIRSSSHLRICGVADVHELDADRAAVGLAQDRDQLAQASNDPPSTQRVVEDPVQVGLGQPERGRLQHVRATRAAGLSFSGSRSAR